MPLPTWIRHPYDTSNNIFLNRRKKFQLQFWIFSKIENFQFFLIWRFSCFWFLNLLLVSVAIKLQSSVWWTAFFSRIFATSLFAATSAVIQDITAFSLLLLQILLKISFSFWTASSRFIHVIIPAPLYRIFHCWQTGQEDLDTNVLMNHNDDVITRPHMSCQHCSVQVQILPLQQMHNSRM